MSATKAEVAATIQAIKAVADTIKELGQVPSGHLYNALMTVLDLPKFERIIGILVRSGVVRKQGDLLVWNAQAVAA